MKKKKIIENAFYILISMLTLLCAYFQIRSYRKSPGIVPKIYNGSCMASVDHWSGKISEACEQCHCAGRYKPKCWWQKDVVCSNCRHSSSKFKQNYHYMYTEAMPCKHCSHIGNIPKAHEEAGLPCGKCGHGNVKHYKVGF